jgi:hypothetical protein
MLSVGRFVSATLTWKLQLLLVPLIFVAVQVTCVVPRAKLDPVAGWQVTLISGQLSVLVAAKFTIWLHVAELTFVTMLPGQVNVGGSVSITKTLKLQLAVLPLASVAVQFTGVVPLPKLDPLAGVQLTLAPGQLSPKFEAKFTTCTQVPAAVLVTISSGHVRDGNSWSSTVTVKLHDAMFPFASVAVQVTGVAPFANELPLAGTHA